MSVVLYLFVAFLALSALVFFHELGHYSAAKFFGVHVERFSIGFGKVVARKQWANTEWAFSAIPLGGYVKMKGQNDADPTATDSADDSYTSKRPWQRIVILLAGPFANFILAFVIYLAIGFMQTPSIVAAGYQLPLIKGVTPDKPAQKIGLKKGDLILAVNAMPIEYWFEIGEQIALSKGDVHLLVQRGAQELTFVLPTQNIDSQNEFKEKIKRKVIGIESSIDKNTTIDFSPSQALFYAWNETKKASILIATGVKKITTGEVSSKEVGGAITIFDLIMKFAALGFVYLLFIMAIISVNLGVMNLLPIPALDGGHIVFNLYEMVTRKPPSENAIYILSLLGWAMLFGLMGLGLYNDINKLFGGN